MADAKQPKKQGFWSKLGNGLAEIIAQVLYNGPR